MVKTNRSINEFNISDSDVYQSQYNAININRLYLVLIMCRDEAFSWVKR